MRTGPLSGVSPASPPSFPESRLRRPTPSTGPGRQHRRRARPSSRAAPRDRPGPLPATGPRPLGAGRPSPRTGWPGKPRTPKTAGNALIALPRGQVNPLICGGFRSFAPNRSGRCRRQGTGEEKAEKKPAREGNIPVGTNARAARRISRSGRHPAPSTRRGARVSPDRQEGRIGKESGVAQVAACICRGKRLDERPGERRLRRRVPGFSRTC